MCVCEYECAFANITHDKVATKSTKNILNSWYASGFFLIILYTRFDIVTRIITIKIFPGMPVIIGVCYKKYLFIVSKKPAFKDSE